MRFNRFRNFTLRDVDDGGEGGGNGGGGDQGEGGSKTPTPSEAEAKLVKEVMQKKEALKKAKADNEALTGKVSELETKLSAFDGVNLDEVRQLLAEKVEADKKKLEEKGEWQRLRDQMVSEHQKALGALKSESDTKVAELEKQLSESSFAIDDLTIGRAFGDSNFVRESLTLTPAKARVVYGSHFERKDGKIIGYDKPAGAKDRTPLVNGQNEPFSFEEALQKIVEADPDKDQLIRSKTKQGAGSKSIGSDGKQKVEVGSGRERIAAGLAASKLKMPGA